MAITGSTGNRSQHYQRSVSICHSLRVGLSPGASVDVRQGSAGGPGSWRCGTMGSMRIRRALADLGWRLSSYRLVGSEPPSEPGIFLGAPHTSNWDFIAFLGVAWHYGMPMRVLIKNSWVRGPAGPLIRAMGGIGVDRSRPSGLVTELVDRAGRDGGLQLVIAPKGTRSPRPYWRSGFYRIALSSGLPVTLAGIDSHRRQVEVGPTLTMTGDVRADMDAIRAFYERFSGVVPARRSEPRLREEDSDRPAR